MTYRGDPSSNEVLALVGKGLTFDSGGISIKPAEAMHEMKYDMCGGAGVIAAMYAIGKLKPKLNVIGVIPSSENLPGPRAMKPGDILRAMNGKTIEVINTDAEGRLILADALCYARELGATKLVDAATLTGAVVIALGHAASGVMSNDDAFVGSVPQGRRRHRRTLLAPAALRRLRQADQERYRRSQEYRRPPGRRRNGRRVPAELRGRRTVDPSRHRRHGVPR